MTVGTGERADTSALEDLEAQALFAEARARRNRLRFLTGALVVLCLAGGVIGAEVSGLIGTRPPSTAAAPSGLPISASDPHSEIVTVSVVSTPASNPYGPADFLREAVTLGTPRPSVEVLAANGPEFYDLPMVVDGVTYSKVSAGGVSGWQASRLAIGPIPPALSPRAAVNSLDFVRQISLGQVVRLGIADIDATPMTEYRATISVVKLYALATPDGALAGLIYKLAYPSPASAGLTFPLEVWVDPLGQAVQARTAVPAVPPVHGYGASPLTYTVSLSGFSVQVKAVAPPAREIIQTPPPGLVVSSPTFASATVHVRAPGGRDFSERGLLVLSMTEVGGRRPGQRFLGQYLSVQPNGAYIAPVPGSLPNLSATLRLSASFYPYPEPGTVFNCGARPAEGFPSGTLARGIDFVCSP